MREIKFRAWNKVGKKMSKSASLVDWILAACTVAEKSLDRDWSAGIFLQYTGLKDKNGKEIYEGDIVRFIEYGHERIGEVVCDETLGCWSIRYKFGNLDAMTIMMMSQGLSEYEVIGNIYENPELLETK